MHTHKNTRAYFYSSHSPYIKNREAHTRLACFCCVIGVLAGTVAAGESVLETQNRLRLVKQIITSPHWHAGSSQHTNKKDRVCVCARLWLNWSGSIIFNIVEQKIYLRSSVLLSGWRPKAWTSMSSSVFIYFVRTDINPRPWRHFCKVRTFWPDLSFKVPVQIRFMKVRIIKKYAIHSFSLSKPDVCTTHNKTPLPAVLVGDLTNPKLLSCYAMCYATTLKQSSSRPRRFVS